MKVWSCWQELRAGYLIDFKVVHEGCCWRVAVAACLDMTAQSEQLESEWLGIYYRLVSTGLLRTCVGIGGGGRRHFVVKVSVPFVP